MLFTARKDENSQGFTMSFKNKYTISVQFGTMNYCSINEKGRATSAEISIWDNYGTFYSFDDDTVKGYCSTDEVAEWIEKVKSFDNN